MIDEYGSSTRSPNIIYIYMCFSFTTRHTGHKRLAGGSATGFCSDFLCIYDICVDICVRVCCVCMRRI